MKKAQLELLKKQKSAYGGSLYTTRAARKEKRPLAVKNTMHLVLRSSKALGAWSLTKGRHEPEIRRIVKKFAERFGVRVLSLAVVGNHLHFQIKLSNRFLYTPFIRAVSAAIAMAVTGVNKWTKKDTRIPQDSTKRNQADLPKAERSEARKSLPRLSGHEFATHRPAGRESNAKAAAANKTNRKPRLAFWEGRPFTRILESFQGFLNLRSYIWLNQIEGYGYARGEARFILEQNKLEWSTG